MKKLLILAMVAGVATMTTLCAADVKAAATNAATATTATKVDPKLCTKDCKCAVCQKAAKEGKPIVCEKCAKAKAKKAAEKAKAADKAADTTAK